MKIKNKTEGIIKFLKIIKFRELHKNLRGTDKKKKKAKGENS